MDILSDIFSGFVPSFRLPSTKHVLEVTKNVFIPHYIVNVFLALSFFLLKTIPPFCEYMFDDCVLDLVSPLTFKWVG